MKKQLFPVLFLAVISAGAYAIEIPLSAGAGGLAGYTFTRYTLECESSASDGNTQILSKQSMDRFNYGGYMFFDAFYGVFQVALQGGYNSWAETMDNKPKNSSWSSLANDAGTGSEVNIGVSLLGKYPFTINDTISWFPMLGVEYQFALVEWRRPEGDRVYDRTKGELMADLDKNSEPYPLSAWNSLWVHIGAGLDYEIAGPFYLRGEAMFGFRLQTPYETGALEMTKKQFNVASQPKLGGLTGGPNFKIGLGYRL